MSPEQARGRPDIDHRSDLWSLGVIAFECMTGQRPFDGATLADLVMKICAEPLPVPSSIAPVPPGFDGWFARALGRDPNTRFQSAAELSEALRVIVGGTFSLPPPSMASTAYTMQASLPPPKKSSMVLPMLLGVVALGILA